jgi:Spy/CpxP family protein refolding chaperone
MAIPKHFWGKHLGQHWRVGFAAIAGISLGIGLLQTAPMQWFSAEQPTAVAPLNSGESNAIDPFAALLFPEAAMATECCLENEGSPEIIARFPKIPLTAARRRGRQPGTLLQKLDLSSKQLRDLNGLREKALPQLRTSVAQLQAEKAKLRKLLASNASEGEIQTQFEQVQAARQDLDQFRFENVSKMRALLTPEQRQTLANQLVGGQAEEIRP